MYKIRETQEAMRDVTNLALYIIEEFGNQKAAMDFLDRYDEKIQGLRTFPFGYRGIGFEYRGYEIRMKPYDTYNIFFVVDHEEIIVLRVLKDREDWQAILLNHSSYRL